MTRTLAAALLVLAGCAGGAPSSSPPDSGTPRAEAPLSAELFPFAASTAGFADQKDGAARTLRVEPAADGVTARLVLEVPGVASRVMTATRRGGSVFFSGGVDVGTELLRGGAAPGAAWESDGRRVRFDGWERLTLPAGTYDAARISARRGPTGLEEVETWWFAPGVGLVRLRSDHGTLFVDELVRTTP
jgi:hypothetical protein